MNLMDEKIIWFGRYIGSPILTGEGEILILTRAFNDNGKNLCHVTLGKGDTVYTTLSDSLLILDEIENISEEELDDLDMMYGVNPLEYGSIEDMPCKVADYLREKSYAVGIPSAFYTKPIKK